MMDKKMRRHPLFGKVRHVHMVGIGGIGMSAIADILLQRDFIVSGSDNRLSEITSFLQQRGAIIFEGHRAEHIEGADVVVHTSAVAAQENEETRAALSKNIPVIKRAEILAELMQRKFSIGVAGTHGKTTTTTMTAQVVQAGGFDPTAVVGGRVESFEQNNALVGNGDIVVVEADEFDRTFLKLPASVAIITNIEVEHVDIYRDLDDLKEAFLQFAAGVPFYGAVIVCIDDPVVRSLVDQIEGRTITYGLSPEARLRAVDIEEEGFYSEFTVILDDKELGRARLKAPGDHNVRNALAAVAAGLELQISFEQIRQGLANYTGILRRFHCQADTGEILVIDDYAHHPTEVAATLEAAKKGWPKRRLVAVFQPHLYSRTRQFHDQFGKSLAAADVLVVTDVYPSREEKIEGVTGQLIADAAQKAGHLDVHYVVDKVEIPSALKVLVEPGDIVVTMGAGDIDQYGKKFCESL